MVKISNIKKAPKTTLIGIVTGAAFPGIQYLVSNGINWKSGVIAIVVMLFFGVTNLLGENATN